MNGQPHAHKVGIETYTSYWYVNYGDQWQRVYKDEAGSTSPSWLGRLFGHTSSPARTERKVLEEAIEQIIVRHDEASKQAEQCAQFIAEVTPKLDERQWGSDQLRNLKR